MGAENGIPDCVDNPDYIIAWSYYPGQNEQLLISKTKIEGKYNAKFTPTYNSKLTGEDVAKVFGGDITKENEFALNKQPTAKQVKEYLHLVEERNQKTEHSVLFANKNSHYVLQIY